jgi:hypothetical protein
MHAAYRAPIAFESEFIYAVPRTTFRRNRRGCRPGGEAGESGDETPHPQPIELEFSLRKHPPITYSNKLAFVLGEGTEGSK